MNTVEELADKYNLPVRKIREGYFTAEYFNRTKDVVRTYGRSNEVTMQVFQRKNAILCGVEEALAILEVGSGEYIGTAEWDDHFEDLEIETLLDGQPIEPMDTVMHITGFYPYFAHLESLYLGVLARRTKVATNTRRCVEAAGEKPVLFFADRFDHFANQEGDGYAAVIGGAASVATPAMARHIDGMQAGGTTPHALIANFDGSVVNATNAFANVYPEVPLVPTVDFNNDCVRDSLAALQIHGENLAGVRLDTSGNMVDASIAWQFRTGGSPANVGDFKPTGVNPTLVENVRKALDKNDGQHVKIYVSGGFMPEKINAFESNGVPVDGYGVGSSLLAGQFDFTADIVKPIAKVGRRYRSIL